MDYKESQTILQTKMYGSASAKRDIHQRNKRYESTSVKQNESTSAKRDIHQQNERYESTSAKRNIHRQNET